MMGPLFLISPGPLIVLRRLWHHPVYTSIFGIALYFGSMYLVSLDTWSNVSTFILQCHEKNSGLNRMWQLSTKMFIKWRKKNNKAFSWGLSDQLVDFISRPYGYIFSSIQKSIYVVCFIPMSIFFTFRERENGLNF